jgi:hypothetical protein
MNFLNNSSKNLSANSLLPLGTPGANIINTLRTNVNRLNTSVQEAVNTATGGYMMPLGIFVVFLVLFLFILSYFNLQIKQGYDFVVDKIRGFLGYSQTPLDPPTDLPGEDVLNKAVAPQDETQEQKSASQGIVEKILPAITSPEVFNISKNTFTYYDAEPLCRALGAELATYDQVKKAWEKGADWCNYGWVKGQAAVYPTQKSTYDELQAGPEDQRTSCGVPGLNGGYFDNPELRFGVNCYGPKPDQSDHDAAQMNKGAPLSPDALEMEKKVAHFRTEASSLGVMPFSGQKWSSS